MQRKNAIYALMCASPLVLFLWYICTYSTNIPGPDDPVWTLTFLRDYQNLNSVSDKIARIFAIYGLSEYRIVVTELIILTYHKVFGYINFKYITIFSNVFLIGVPFIFLHAYNNKGDSYPHKTHFAVAFIAAACVLLQPQHHFNYIFYAPGNLPIIFFSIATLYIVSFAEKKMDYLMAFILLTISIFTYGSGIVLVIPFLCVLIFNRKYLLSLLVTIYSAVVYYLWFYNQKDLLVLNDLYTRKYTYPLAEKPFQFIGLYLQNIGGLLDFEENTHGYLSFLLGISIVGFVSYLILSHGIKYYSSPNDGNSKKIKFILSCLLFCVLVILIVSVKRFYYFNYYKIYSSIILMCVIWLTYYFKMLKTLYAIGISSILFFIYSYNYYHNDVLKHHNSMLAMSLNWNVSPKNLSFPKGGVGFVKDSDENYLINLFEFAHTSKVYSYPKNPDILNVPSEKALKMNIEYKKNGDIVFFIEKDWQGNVFDKFQYFLLLRNPKNNVRYFLPLSPNFRVIDILRKRNHRTFHTYIEKWIIEQILGSNNFEYFVCQINDGKMMVSQIENSSISQIKP